MHRSRTRTAGGSFDQALTIESKGDTLSAIAEQFYGKGHGGRYLEIVKANTPPVKNPDMIQPGWVLRIPAAA